MAKEELHMRKIDTKSNPADLMTKFLSKDDKNNMLKFMNMETVDEKDINARSIYNVSPFKDTLARGSARQHIVALQQDYWAKITSSSCSEQLRASARAQNCCARRLHSSSWDNHLC